MKYLNNYKLFEKLNEIDLLLEDFDSNKFYNFYKNIQNNVQTKSNVDIVIDPDKLKTIIDLDSKNLFTIKDGRHIKQVKPSKLLKGLDSTQLERFSNIIKSYNNNDKIEFEELSGKDSHKQFEQKEQIQSSSHSLKNDCMRYKHAQDYWKILEKNPNQLSVLYAHRDGLENNGLSGFVLLFNVNEQKYYDRIFGYNIEDAILIEKYCIEYGYKDAFKLNIELNIQLDEWIFDKYPYMDTFKYLDIKTGILSNHYNKDNIYIFDLVSTTGKISELHDMEIIWSKLVNTYEELSEENVLKIMDSWRKNSDVNNKEALPYFVKMFDKTL
jgi:hypothetical protein